jgi:hypothetical protein
MAGKRGKTDFTMPDDIVDLTGNKWNRLSNEPQKAWEAFQLFIRLPTIDRKYTTVAKALKKHLSQIKMWGRKYHWQSRAANYDAFLAQSEAETYSKELGLLQAVVTQQELEDVNRLRDAWSKALDTANAENTMTPLEMNRLTVARQGISILARRATRMQTTYKEPDEPGDDTPVSWTLTMDGGAKPVYGGYDLAEKEGEQKQLSNGKPADLHVAEDEDLEEEYEDVEDEVEEDEELA